MGFISPVHICRPLTFTFTEDLPPLTQRQERRAKATALTGPTRGSISSWDFSIDLSHTPDAHPRSSHNSVHPGYFNTVHSQHSQYPPHSHHTTIALPSPRRLDALDENAFADAFEQARITQRSTATYSDDEGGVADVELEDDSHSSVESSVFDEEDAEDEVSNPTTPEIAATSVASSSVVATPLSCSPATALDMPVQPGRPAVSPTPNIQCKTAPPSRSTPSSALLSKAKSNARSESVDRQKTSKSQHSPLSHRRGSLPASTATDRENLVALPALKRIASASARSSSKASSTSGSAKEEPLKPDSGTQSPVPKGSRWRKLMRSSVGGERTDESSASPPRTGSLRESEKRKSTLGRILERSAR